MQTPAISHVNLILSYDQALLYIELMFMNCVFREHGLASGLLGIGVGFSRVGSLKTKATSIVEGSLIL